MKGIVGTSGGQIQPGERNKILRKPESEKEGEKETRIGPQDGMRPLLKPPSALILDGEQTSVLKNKPFHGKDDLETRLDKPGQKCKQ